jgi:hypothetical protein
MMDHDHVRDVLDRSATSPLIARLLSDDPDAAEREEIERTLIALDDVRSVIALQAAGENPAVSPVVRVSALQVLTSMLGARVLPIREWWASPDPVLRFSAAGVLAYREFGDLARPVLDDPHHPMLARVLGSMDIGFEERTWQEAKVRALANSSSAVRAAAASSLLWDEPLMAHDALVAATSDLDLDVATEAVSTLMYYPTSTVVEALSVLVESPNELLASSADAARSRVLSDIADSVAVASSSPVMAPWRTLLRHYGGAESESESGVVDVSAILQPTAGRPKTTWTKELEHGLADLDGPWVQRYADLRDLDPHSVVTDEHERVVEFLANHPDPEVRMYAAQHFPLWQGGPRALLRLLDDPMVTVSKFAMFALHDVETSPDLSPTIRDLAWEAVTDGTRVGTRASEALRTFVRHGDACEASLVTRHVVGLAGDERESVRAAALEQLVSRNCRDELESTMPSLGESPDITWAIHGTLLDAAFRFGIDVGRHTLLRLARQDHAWLCGAVARLLPTG